MSPPSTGRLLGLLFLITYLFKEGISSIGSNERSTIWETNPPSQVLSVIDDDGVDLVRYFRNPVPLNGGYQAVVYSGWQQILRPPYLFSPVAIRVVWKNPSRARIIERTQYELMLQAELKNEHVLGLIKIFYDRDYVYSISDFADKSDLMDVLVKRNRVFSENDAKMLFQQAVSGLDYLHSQKIIHRDIKLDNLLVWSDGTVKIGDFGFAVKLNSQNNHLLDGVFVSIDAENGVVISKGKTGSGFYISPEICARFRYSYQSDVYALGMALFVMLAGEYPNQPDCKVELSRDYLDRVLETAGVSQAASSLVKRMLKGNPEERITLAEVMADTWLADHSIVQRPITPNKENLKRKNGSNDVLQRENPGDGERTLHSSNKKPNTSLE